MNLCVISEYTSTFDDFEKMVEQNQNEEVITDRLLVKVNDHKSVLLLNCVDMEAFQALMTSAEMKQWDEDNGCVDICTLLECINKMEKK